MYNLSSSPHVRGGASTRSIMWDVCIALIPATAFGVYRFGIYSLLVVLVSILFAVLSEYMYQKLTDKDVLVSDGSAVLTGLLIGLNMPPEIPLWIPALGSIFAIVVVKQFFGGLGKNFMNPALAGRCFLLISFTSLMSDFSVDGVSSATPLAQMAEGKSVDLAALFTGFTGGTIGEVSTLAILIGGIYLLIKKVITWEIPVIYLASFAVFMFIFGTQSFSITYVAAQLCAGGIMLGAWFMATDYVTSPLSRKGRVIYALCLGILTGIMRCFGASAEGVSYSIIFCNLLVPLIDKVTLPKAFGLEHVKKEKAAPAAAAAEGAEEAKAEPAPKAPISMKAYHAALNLTIITLIAGLLLGAAYQLTKEPIEQAELAEEMAAYASVCPQADKFSVNDNMIALAEAEEAAAGIADGAYGSVVLDSAYTGLDKSGNTVGYIINITTKEGFGGDISLSVGFDSDHSITGIAFLSISETAGLGMNAQNESFYSQYMGKNVDEFTVVKTGSTSDSEIDALSGATVTSRAVTKAVNAALYIVNNAE